jgi:uncharacterized phosphosugar-binding protein
MSKYFNAYYETVTGIFQDVLKEETAIGKAAFIIAQKIMEDKLVHVIGPGGHSNMGAHEMFWRAGGLVPINAVLDAGTALIHGAKRSNIIERLPGYAKAIFDSYRIEDGVLIIVNAYGINSQSIDCALLAKERGIPSIGITSRSFCDNVPADHPARHPSGKNLFESVDVFINCHLPYGDATTSIDGVDQKVAPTSTMANCFTINLLLIKTVEMLKENGFDPPLWKSANLPGGDESNKKYETKYGGRIKHLL